MRRWRRRWEEEEEEDNIVVVAVVVRDSKRSPKVLSQLAHVMQSSG